MSRIRLLAAIMFLFALIGIMPPALAGNPLIWHVYAADPSAHVWPGDGRIPCPLPFLF